MLGYAATALLASLGFAAGVSGRPAERTGLEAAPTPRFADVTLATGVRLRYAEQGDRSGPAVILLHAFGAACDVRVGDELVHLGEDPVELAFGPVGLLVDAVEARLA